MRGLGQMKIDTRLRTQKARLWHASLRLWMWRWQTLSPEDRAVFYRQPEKTGYLDQRVSFDTLWLFKHPLGREKDRTISEVTWRDIGPKMFDAPRLTTMGKDFVRYQLLPCAMHGHRVDLVNHYIWVNENEPALEIWSGHFHCICCGLMGSEKTMQGYHCDGPRNNSPSTKATPRRNTPQSDSRRLQHPDEKDRAYQTAIYPGTDDAVIERRRQEASVCGPRSVPFHEAKAEKVQLS